MSERQKQDSEKMLISNILVGAILFIIIGVALIPNSPRIIITESNEPSFRTAEVEPNVIKAFAFLPSPIIRQSLGFFIVTAYCPCEKCCGDYADGITANGHRIQFGDRFCAADPLIPFGKYLDIPGYGYVPVWDRGKDIEKAKLDVFYPTHKEALEWGTQELEIFCWVERE